MTPTPTPSPRSSGTPRSGRVTLRDVALAAHVHHSTASRALDPDRRSLIRPSVVATVEAAAAKLGYQANHLARGLRRGRTNTVGVLVPDLGNPSWAAVLQGVASALDSHGFLALVGDTYDDHVRYERLLEQLTGWRVDAIVSAATRLGDRDMFRRFNLKGVPIVLVVRDLPKSRIPAVTDDGHRGGVMAANHLLSLGHVLISQLRGPADVQAFRDRASGFARVVTRTPGARLVEVDDVAARPTYEEGRRLMEQLLGATAEVPTAIFAANDAMAIGAIDVIGSVGLRCPADVSVLGYNDSPLMDHVFPQLTTIRLPGAEIGALAGRMAIEIIENPDARPASASVVPTLVTRATTVARFQTVRTEEARLSESSA